VTPSDRTIGSATGPLRGAVVVPGDKSLSHRAVLFAALAEGRSHITGVLDSADVRSTLSAVAALGAGIAVRDSGSGGLDVYVDGWGDRGPTSPTAPIDCGNSGTTARLLMGVLAGWDVEATLVGDESLSKRPMARVTDPLSHMGARFESRGGGMLPVTVRGGGLRPMAFVSDIASAQVKSAVLLAGLRACGRTVVSEPMTSRDHTERLLPAFGVEVGTDEAACSAWVDGPCVPIACDVDVPGDPSSAAFLVAAGLLVPRSTVVVRYVCLNPTRTGAFEVLRRMGAKVSMSTEQVMAGEPVGTVTAEHGGALRATVVSAEEVPSLVDEVPILAVVATAARGTTRFEGVSELRVKESDRLAAVAAGLRSLGADARSGPDWLEVDGPARLTGGRLDSLGDHRLAMSWAVAALVALAPVAIARFDAVDVSYPDFMRDVSSLMRP